MNKHISAGLICLLAAVSIAAGQAKQPQPKSQKEVEAILAIQNAADAASRIKAAEALLKNFADTEFKAFAYQVAAASAQMMNDFEKMVIFAEKTLEVEPASFAAMIMLASGIPQRTREFDLDKEEKLGKAEKYAKEAETAVKTAPKPRPDITDEQWEGVKKDIASQSHEALGMIAMVRKKYDLAIQEFKTSIQTGASQDPATKIRLASAYNNNGNFDEAAVIADQLMADPQLDANLKQFAQAEKTRAQQGKAAKK